MLEELAYKVDILNSNKFGSFIVRNWFVAEFKRSRADWQQLVERGDKVADSFKVVPQIDPSVKLYNHGEGPY